MLFKKNKKKAKWVLGAILSILGSIGLCPNGAFAALEQTKLQAPSSAVTSAASSKSSHNDKDNDFTIRYKPGPPPGFSDAIIDQAQMTYVSVYYGNQFMGNFMATFTRDWLRFEDVSAVAKVIPGLDKVAEFEKDISGKLPTHVNALCQPRQPSQPLCQVPKPDPVSLVFDQGSYKAYVFIDPKLLLVNKLKLNTLPASTSAFSVMNQMNTSLSSSSSSQSINWLNQAYFGYHNQRLLLDTSLAANHYKTLSGADSTQQSDQTSGSLNINRLAYGTVIGDKLYQGGILTTFGSDFLTTQQILGISFQNSYQEYGALGDTLNTQLGTPIVVYLSLPSQVNVYRGNNLIYSANLSAGRQQLDTTGFPVGSYEVTLKIQDSLGQTTTQTQYFVKQSGFYGQDWHYYLLLGLQSKTSGFYSAYPMQTLYPSGFSVNVPQFKSQLVVNYFAQQKLASYLGLQTDFLSDFQSAYGSLLINWYLPAQLTLSPGLLLTTNGYYGEELQANWNNSWLSLGFSGIKFQSHDSDQENANKLADPDAFFPLPNTNYQVNSNIGLNVLNTNLSLGYILSDSYTGNRFQTYSANVTRSIYNDGGTNALFTLLFTHSDQDNTLSANLNFNFFTPSQWSFSASVGQDWSKTQGDTTNQQATSIQLQASKAINYDAQRQLLTSLNYNYQQEANSLTASMTYQSPWLAMTANLVHNWSNLNSASTTLFSANLNSSFVYADSHFSFGYSPGDWFSGVIIDAQSDVASPVNVYVNGSQVATVYTNHPQPIFLMPFKTYQISINPAGKQLLSYSSVPKVVTLYKGNVQTLTWHLGRQYLLFAQIVNAKGEPLQNWLLNNPGEFDTTDASGFIQAGLSTRKHQLHFKNIEGQACVVDLPQDLQIKEQVLVLKKPLTCLPVSNTE